MKIVTTRNLTCKRQPLTLKDVEYFHLSLHSQVLELMKSRFPASSFFLFGSFTEQFCLVLAFTILHLHLNYKIFFFISTVSVLRKQINQNYVNQARGKLDLLYFHICTFVFLYIMKAKEREIIYFTKKFVPNLISQHTEQFCLAVHHCNCPCRIILQISQPFYPQTVQMSSMRVYEEDEESQYQKYTFSPSQFESRSRFCLEASKARVSFQTFLQELPYSDILLDSLPRRGHLFFTPLLHQFERFQSHCHLIKSSNTASGLAALDVDISEIKWQRKSFQD